METLTINIVSNEPIFDQFLQKKKKSYKQKAKTKPIYIFADIKVIDT